MASTYSTNLKIELQATGDNPGTWGTITNTNLGTALEQAIVGYGNPSYASDANLTLTYTNTNAAQTARSLVLNVTSAVSLTATRELVVPTIQKQYIVQNNTTGAQSITVKTSAGTGITVPNGRKAHLYVDGTNVIQMFDFVDINGGTIDGTTIGGASAGAGTFTTLTATTLGGALNANSQAITNVNIDSGTIDGTTIGGSSAGAGTFTTLTTSSTVTLNGGTANGLLYLNGSKVATSGSAVTFNGTNLETTGTASATKLIPTGGTATGNGMYLPATNTLALSTNGTERVRVDSSGNLGVGRTPSGSAIVDVQNDANAIIRVRGGAGSNEGSAFYGVSGSDTTRFAFGQVSRILGGTPNDDAVVYAAGYLAFAAAGSERARIDSSGNLGIGITSPLSKINAVGGIRSSDSSTETNAIQMSASATAGTIETRYGTPLVFGTNATERARIDASGNFGLGVTPSAWSGGFKATQYPGGSVASYASGTNLQIEVGNAYYQSSLGTYAYYNTGTAPTLYRQISGEHRWLTAPSGTAGNAITFTQAMTLGASGNLLVGTTTDFTTTGAAGSVAVSGYGVYPYTTYSAPSPSGLVNTTNREPLVIASSASFDGSSSISYHGIGSYPIVSATGTGGTSGTSVYGFSAWPQVPSSGASARLSVGGIIARAIRASSSDASSNASNSITGIFGVAGIEGTVASGASAIAIAGVSSSVYSGSGTTTALSGVTSRLEASSVSTDQNTTITTASLFIATGTTLGRASGPTTSITNLYGINLTGPNVLATATVTNYYAFFAAAPTVTGTLTNRWGVYIADASSPNYFAGNLGIGSTSPEAKLHLYNASGDVRNAIIANGVSDAAFQIAAWQGVSGAVDGIVVGRFGLSYSTTKNAYINFHRGAGTTGGFLSFSTNDNTERARVKSTGQVRFVPLSADPAGAEAGDVYYNSTTNKLKVYNGSAWVDLH